MKLSIIFFTACLILVIGCQSSHVQRLQPSDQPRVECVPSGLNKAEIEPVNPLTASKEVRLFPLHEAERDRWQINRGRWKFGTNSLIGSGDSSIRYTRSIPVPFELNFKLEVLDGMRPRVFFDRFTFSNEGYKLTLGLYPQAKDSKLYSYQLGVTNVIQIKVSEHNIEVHVNGELIDSRDEDIDFIPYLEFSGGDGWSAGSTKFSDISIRYYENDSGL